MKEYQPFPISNFRTGFDEAVEPWLLPKDGYQILKNAHLYRGVIEKVPGYDIYARMSYRETIQLLSDPGGTGPDGVATKFIGTLTYTPSTDNFYAQSAIDNTGTTVETWHYDSDTAPDIINLASNLGGTGTVNLTTKAVVLNFNTPPAEIPLGANLYNEVIFSYDYLATNVAAAGDRDIMGIKQYYAQNGSREIVVFDTNRAGKVVTLTSLLIATAALADNGIEEIPHEVHAQGATTVPAFNGAIATFTGSVAAPVVPGSVSFILYSNTPAVLCTITDNGIGALTGVGTPTATGFINYFTGAWTLTFSVNPAATDTLNTSVCNYGTTFTGDYTNFFSTQNYNYNMFITNGVDNIRYYDGACILFYPAQITSAINSFTYDVTTCLHVCVERDRLVLFYPTTALEGQLPNVAIWSEIFNPLSLRNNERLPAPTSEAIRLWSRINTDVIVRFANSERVFRYTGDAFSPFRWDTTNSIWRTDSRYSDINYDSYFTAVGKPAIVGSDGVNMQRADEIIPDFTLQDRALIDGPVISIDQTSIGQCYGERFDDFKEGWLCFRKNDKFNANPGDDKRSDNILAFNYLDHTYAVYEFPFNCLGFGQVTSVDTWGNNFDQWIQADYAWVSFFENFDALVDLGGDRNGVVYTLGNYNDKVNEEGVRQPILFDVITGNFNPFIDQGELCRFGYLDLFVSANASTKLRVQIYRDDTMYEAPDGTPSGAYQETTLTFLPTDSMSPTQAQTKVWKRVYVGAVAREHTIRLYQNEDDFADSQNQPVRIHGLVLYMKPAGRIFN
jgi:hypothetical protein